MDDDDVYVNQLKEVFDSCDEDGNGELNCKQLEELCLKLQVEDQTEQLVDHLLANKDRVGFYEFKEGFVAVLSEAVEKPDNDKSLSDIDEQDIDIESEDSYLEFEINTRKSAIKDDNFDSNKEDGKDESSKSEPKDDKTEESDKAQEKVENKDAEGDKKSEVKVEEEVVMEVQENSATAKESVPPLDGVTEPEEDEKMESETFEAEGQLNQSITTMENAIDPVSEEQHLKDIWKELGVGKNGHLTIEELSKVCQHIGMDEMNDEELQHLFDKLDVDQDGGVSFDEFLTGLFQHGGPNTSSTPVRPLSTPRQKLHLTMAPNSDDRATPSSFSSGLCLFTLLDPENTGYANSDEVITMWEKMGIMQGRDILEYLEFDVDTKVNLADLSAALEQEMKSVEDDNATYQAAMMSYQQELKFQHSLQNQMMEENNKLRMDLAESNNRNDLLIKESEERHSALEKSKENDIYSIERKYQDQIRYLQTEIDSEREQLLHQSSKQRYRLEGEIDKLKDEESKLKDKLSQTQRELGKLEGEIFEMAEKCSDLERHNLRQQRDLDSAASMQIRLAEMESNRDKLQDDHDKFTQEKILHLEADKKEMKDRNDELIMEVDDLKQQLSVSKSGRAKKNEKEAKVVKRQGSVLSDYASPMIPVRRSISDVSTESEGDEKATKKGRRKLPSAPSFEGEVEKLKGDIQDLKREKDKLEDDAAKELRELKSGFERERKEIEQAFKIEIAGLEEEHLTEKEKRMKNVNREKDEIRQEAEDHLKNELKNKEDELRKSFEQDKQDLVIQYESEKNLMEQKFAENKMELISSMRKDFSEDLEVQLVDLRHENEELEKSAIEAKTMAEMLQKRVSELENTTRTEKVELSKAHSQEKAAMTDQYSQEMAALNDDLIEQHKQKVIVYENMLTKGVEGLDGKLKDDFYNLLKEETTREVEKEVKIQVETELQTAKKNLKEEIDMSKVTSEEKYKMQIADLEREIEQNNKKFERYKERQEEEQKEMKNALEEEITTELSAQLEGEFVEQINQIKEAFNEERSEQESRIQMLQEEIEEIQRDHDQEEKIREALDKKASTSNVKLEREIADLEALNRRFEIQIEKEKEYSNQEKEALREQLHMAESYSVQANTEISMLKSAKIQASKDEQDNMVAAVKYNNLNLKLQDVHTKVRELEAALEKRAAETGKLLMVTQEEHKRALTASEDEQVDLKRQLNKTTALLEEQVHKLNSQYKKLTKSDILVKDLYLENAQLMKTLENTERRGKNAEKKVFKLEDRCKALQKVIKKVCPLAIG